MPTEVKFGLMYPSAVRPDGRNLALLPRRDGWQWVFDGVKYRDASELSLKTWVDVFKGVRRATRETPRRTSRRAQARGYPVRCSELQTESIQDLRRE